MKIYTDGSYDRKFAPTLCGYAAIFIMEEDTEKYTGEVIYGAISEPDYYNMWNVGGEIWAVIAAIDYAINILKVNEIDIYYDYMGIEMWGTGQWKTNNPTTRNYANYIRKNKQIVPIRFHKVKGHSNDKMNDLADMYAGKGIIDYKSPEMRIQGFNISKI